MTPPKLHLGTIGWSYTFWKGNFYPAKTASKDFLGYYAGQFGTVEVDSTFYRIPTEQTIRSWGSQTPKGFLFSFKFPQLITHIRQLRDCQVQTASFLSRLEPLGDRVGALLLQFPPSFTAKHQADLAEYLHSLPDGYRYVVEVRHRSWLTPDFFSLLRMHHVAYAWTDSQYVPETAEVTSDFLYVRWEGNRAAVVGTLGRIEVDQTADLHLWADKLRPYLERGMEVFGYFGKYYSGYPPNDILAFQKSFQQ
ncbi:MAG: DUF72 domain-containing protein [Candidatus Bathyarchaeota archaeon]|nr:DUF72 domain-containing protein [Candidatus Bathyarchaeota archaeon]